MSEAATTSGAQDPAPEIPAAPIPAAPAPGVEVALSYGLPSGGEWGQREARARLAGARERPGLRYAGQGKDPIAFRELLGALYDGFGASRFTSLRATAPLVYDGILPPAPCAPGM